MKITTWNFKVPFWNIIKNTQLIIEKVNIRVFYINDWGLSYTKFEKVEIEKLNLRLDRVCVIINVQEVLLAISH